MDPREVLAEADEHAPNVGDPPIAASVEPVTPDPQVDVAGTTGAVTTSPDPHSDVVDETPIPRPPRSGERACPECGEPNATTRRFCLACGTRLATDTSAEDHGSRDDDDRSKRRPRTWRQRARAAGQGSFRYASGFSTEAKARIVLFVLAGVAAVAAVVGPGRERVMALVGLGDEAGTPPASAELVTARGEPGEEVAGFGPGAVRDDDRATGVAVVWEPEGDVAPHRVRLTLEERTDVRTVHIAAGLADDAADAPLVLKPRRLRVCADSGACQEVGLRDSAALRSYDVDLGDDVRTVDLIVLDVHDTDVTTYPLAVISEVRVDD